MIANTTNLSDFYQPLRAQPQRIEIRLNWPLFSFRFLATAASLVNIVCSTKAQLYN
jgi:hypothetical protein